MCDFGLARLLDSPPSITPRRGKTPSRLKKKDNMKLPPPTKQFYYLGRVIRFDPANACHWYYTENGCLHRSNSLQILCRYIASKANQNEFYGLLTAACEAASSTRELIDKAESFGEPDTATLLTHAGITAASLQHQLKAIVNHVQK